MFGHQDDESADQNAGQISEQAIDAAMSADSDQSTAPAQTVQPTAAPALAATPSTTDSADTPEASAADTALSPASPPRSAPVTADTNSLIDIKQHALTQLQPLIGHLDQTPEEKFRTTMMMIQASDDQSLIQSAFTAAQNIADEKARAQALLDIVNEINYFTQQQDNAAA